MILIFAGLDERDAALNNSLAIMDQAGEERQARWTRHQEGLWLKSRPDTEAREHREGKTINWDKTRGGKAVKYVKEGVNDTLRSLDFARTG